MAASARAAIPGAKRPDVATEAPASESGAQGRWALWFEADQPVPIELRGRTRGGKPKRQPPRYPPNINERRQMHVHVERRTVKRWRELARWIAEQGNMPKGLARVRISAEVYRKRLGAADGSGDSERLKPLVDGLVEAGVIPNDTRRYVEYGPVEERRSGELGDGILLIVEALEPAA